MEIILIALAAALGIGRLVAIGSTKLKMPAVVGEIFAGLFLANLVLVFPGFKIGHELAHSEFLRHLSELGVILMLFAVGLESTLGQVLKVGPRALLVAVVGVVAPFVLAMLAWKAGLIDDRLPNGISSMAVPVFVAATFTATSVGITARILADVGQVRSRTGQIILNAAVIDDILGLLVLAAVTSFVASQAVSLSAFAVIGGKALAFFAISIPLGYFLLPRFLKRVGATSLLAFGLCVCFLYAWGGMFFGLAPIVGAFFAGLLIDEPTDRMHKVLEPIVGFLGPLFFVLIGAQIKLEALAGAGWRTLFEIVLLTVLAIVGKLVCGLVSGKGTDRVAVGIGMAPRGEVGLIFAVTGKQIGVISDELFAVLVFVVLLTTLIPSIALDKWLRAKSTRN